MEKPDVDQIDGLSPAISIDQKGASRNPRSTVGTVTEIYDHLRLLFARIGHPHCPTCGREIERQSVQQMVDQVYRLPEGTRLMVLGPLVKDRKDRGRSGLRRRTQAGLRAGPSWTGRCTTSPRRPPWTSTGGTRSRSSSTASSSRGGGTRGCAARRRGQAPGRGDGRAPRPGPTRPGSRIDRDGAPARGGRGAHRAGAPGGRAARLRGTPVQRAVQLPV